MAPLPLEVQREVQTALLSNSSRCPFLFVVAEVLTSVAAKGGEAREAAGESWDESRAYDAKTVPPVSLHEYIRRWARYTRCGTVAVIVAVIFLDRACVRSSRTVTPWNVHRMLLAALTLAAKWYTDTPYRNTHYAEVGGVTLSELNKLEATILADMDWAISVTPTDLDTYSAMFRNHRMWPAPLQVKLDTQVTPKACTRPSPANIGRPSADVTAAAAAARDTSHEREPTHRRSCTF
eukprot:TRINITY_DN6979_c0_g3_i1.p1 TRINITY_DN6979_c0_g3~~TRINITY_DN6979_c0_g3_i1.p1  ORF type:complete len:271 (+),score=67.51 TRINITY_DN6979_c0_g3_i1:107-814(+)